MRGVGEDGEDTTKYISKLQDEFDRLDIDLDIVKDDGSMESTYNILSALSTKWKDLTDAEKQYIGEVAAGKNRITDFNALMSNFETAISATETAMNSAGSAAKENEKYLNSIQGKMNQFSSAWQELSKNLINSDLVKGVVDLGTAFLKLANSGFGQLIIKISLAMTAFKLLKTGFGSLKSVILSNGQALLQYLLIMQGVPVAEAAASASTLGLAASIKILTAAMLSNPLFWGIAAVSLIYGIIKAINAANVSFEEQSEVVNNLKQEYENIQTEISDAEAEANSLKERIDELLSKDTLTIVEQEELKKLKTENELLEKQLSLLKQAEDVKKREQDEATRQLIGTKTETPKDTRSIKKEALNLERGFWDKIIRMESKATVPDTIQQNIEVIRILNNEITELENKQNSLDISTKKGEEEFNKISGTISRYKDGIKDVTDENITLANSLTEWINSLEGGDEEAESMRSFLIWLQNQVLNTGESLQKEVESTVELSDAEKERLEVLEETSDILSDYLDKEEDNKTLKDNLINTDKEYANVLSGVADAIDLVNGAYEEQNENGTLSLGTIADLISENAELINYLEIEDGQVRLTAGAMEYLAGAQIDAAIANLELQKADATKTLDANKAKAETLTQAYEKLASSGFTAAAAIGLKSILEKTKGDITASENDINKLTKQIETLTQIKVSPSYTSGYSGGTSKKSSSSKSIKDTWKEEFDAQYDALKHSLNMNQITEKEYTDRLEKLYKKYFSNKTKYLDEYNKYEEEVYKNRQKLLEEEIDQLENVLKKQRELAESKYENAIKVATSAIDEQISALEAQKEALKDSNDEQERAIELAKLQEELERAKTQKTMRVFYSDRGWVYEADKAAIDAAQEALDEFEAETQKEIQESAIDAQIKELQNLKDGWSNIAENYEMQQNRIQAALEFGSDFEKNILSNRLEYLKNFVSEYNSVMDKLTADEKNLVNYAASVGIDISGKYANGTISAKGGISLVGEQGAELRVLNKGDGIIPAELTQNLMKWGSFDPINYFRDMVGTKLTPVLAGANNSSETIYNFSNLTIQSDANNLDALIKDIQLKSKNR